MQYRQLDHHSGCTVSALGLGCMGMSEFYGPSNDESSEALIHQAYLDKGINFFDTADMYGKGSNERLLGKAIKPFRNEVVLASKCGFEREVDGVNSIRLNGQYDYIISACNASLARMGVDHIDLYYLHRIDPTVPIEESVQALKDLVTAGKIRFIGLSEVDADTLQRANAIHSITAVQTEYSLMVRQAAEQILPVCRDLNVTFVPYSPIARGLLSGRYTQKDQFYSNDWRRDLPFLDPGNLSKNLDFISQLGVLAQQKNCTLAQLSLAWLLARGGDIIPIPGTRQHQYLQENVGAIDIDLTAEDLKVIEDVCRFHPIQGERFPAA